MLLALVSRVPYLGLNTDAGVIDCRCPEEGIVLCWLRLYSGRCYSFTQVAIVHHREYQHCRHSPSTFVLSDVETSMSHAVTV
jgi:hypothetical protein